MMSVTPNPGKTGPRRKRRGLFLLPSLITVGNMFCGYACVMYAMRGDLAVAAPFIGIAVVLDMMDGRIARMTGTSSEFGLQLDSLADVISFGVAPAILAFAWGLSELGRWGWAVGFLYVTACAMRLARFNVQSTTQADKRYFIGLASPSGTLVEQQANPYDRETFKQVTSQQALDLLRRKLAAEKRKNPRRKPARA